VPQNYFWNFLYNIYRLRFSNISDFVTYETLKVRSITGSACFEISLFFNLYLERAEKLARYIKPCPGFLPLFLSVTGTSFSVVAPQTGHLQESGKSGTFVFGSIPV
jgi:hypothetical protein